MADLFLHLFKKFDVGEWRRFGHGVGSELPLERFLSLIDDLRVGLSFGE